MTNVAPSVLVVSRIVLDDIHHSKSSADLGILGGSGFWAAFGAALVADQVAVTCKVGADFEPYFQVLQRLGIRSDGLVRTEGTTSRTVVTYPEDEERHEEPLPNWDYHVAMRTVFAEFPTSVSKPRSMYVFRGRHDKFWEDLFENTPEATPIVWEIPGSICTPEDQDWVSSILAKVSVLSINESEAQSLTGAANLEEQIQKLHELGAVNIVLRRGSLGCVASDGSQTLSSAPPASSVAVDVTGAGNTFSGAFTAAWSESGGDLAYATAAAMAGSAVAIGQVGPTESLEQGRLRWAKFMAEINVSRIEAY